MLVNTQSIGNPTPNIDPPPLPPSISIVPSNTPITTQPSTSHSPLQYNTPSDTPPPPNNNTVTIQPTTFLIHQPLPPFPISFPSVIITQRQPHSSNTSLPPTLSYNSNHPFPLPASQNLPQTSNRPSGSTTYDHYVSLHRRFHKFPVSFSQPPNLPHNPCPPPQTSEILLILSLLHLLPLVYKLFLQFFLLLSQILLEFLDGLDHSNPSEKCLVHVSERVTIQLGPQPLEIQSYLNWHSRRMSPLFCSLTGTASNGYDRLLQDFKNDWSSFLQIFKNQY